MEDKESAQRRGRAFPAHGKLIENIVEKLTGQTNLGLETLQIFSETLRKMTNLEIRALREEFNTVLQELKEELHLLEQKFSELQQRIKHGI